MFCLFLSLKMEEIITCLKINRTDTQGGKFDDAEKRGESEGVLFVFRLQVRDQEELLALAGNTIPSQKVGVIKDVTTDEIMGIYGIYHFYFPFLSDM